MEPEEIQQVETPTPEAPAPEAPAETLDQRIERIGRQVTTGGLRDESGRFQPKVVAPGAPEGDKVPGSPQAAPPDPVKPVIEAPQSLPADVKAKWQSLPPEIQEYWSKREGEVHQKFTTDGERLKTLSAFEEVAKPLEARLKQVNAPAPEYFRRLAAADQLLASDGIRGIQQIAQMYGIDLRAALNGTPPVPQSQPHFPDVSALVQEQVEQHLREQRVTAKTAEIDKFRSALPADEQADFDTLEPVMAGLYGANQNLTLEQLYRKARMVDDGTAARDKAKADAEAAAKAAEAAKKKQEQDARLGPLSRRPGSAPAGPIKGKNIWDTMDKVGKEVLARN